MLAMRNSRILLIIPLMFIVVLLCPFACGNVIYVDADAIGANDGSSWADGYWCLQNALADAQSDDEIRVAQGIYKPNQSVMVTGRWGPHVKSSSDRTETFQLINGVAIKGGYAGFGEPDPDARDIEVYKTILSGDLNGNDRLNFVNNTENSYHVVTGNGTDETAVLDGFTITAGNANGTDWESQGGGMYNKSGSPTVTNCTFEDNSARGGGGGMSNYNSNPTLTNCVFSGNSTNNNGGGILCHGASSPTITNCIISENTAGGWGGGIDCRDSSPTIINCAISGNAASVAPDSATGGGGINCIDSFPTIINCSISGNTSTDGGGIGCMRSSPTIISCTISSNTSTNSGGGIGCYWNSSPTITNCIVTGNTAGYRAGGINCYESSSPTITNCIITDNNAGGICCYRDSFAIITNNIITGNSSDAQGGGIWCWDNSSPSITNNIIMGNSARFGGGINCNRNCSPSITNNIIVGNSASAQGGGIYCGVSSPDIINNTIIRNWATRGGGIYSGGDDSFPTVHNTILWMDSPQEIYLHAGGSVAVTYSCIQGGLPGIDVDPTSYVTWGLGNIDSDPMFVDAANGNYHLQASSPCIEAGDNSAIPEGVIEDLEGNPRIIYGIVDMGAIEGGEELRFAFNPEPADGAEYVYPNVELSWSSGFGAQLHIVYFGDNFEDVNIDAGGILQETTTYTPGTLELDKGYYWRVDEFDGVVIHKGDIWSFTTANFLIVDDFESYDFGENQIWIAWKDGLGYGMLGAERYYPGNGTGSAVGEIDWWDEETIVHRGNQAMPFFYDNNQQGKLKYSEATLTLSYPRDWTEKGVTTLTIWFRGILDNAPELMYVAIANDNGTTAVVYHDNPNATQIEAWTEWNIDLLLFADQGVNLTDVDTLSIGFGDRNNPQPGGSGEMWFDDIRLYRPRPEPEPEPAP